LVFGRSKFKGFVFARQSEDSELGDVADTLVEKAQPLIHKPEGDMDGYRGRILAVERLAKMPFVKKNQVELHIDGQETVDSIFAGIEEAQDYILIQFFIVHDDGIGNELKPRL
jgi:cardiolipin synthase